MADLISKRPLITNSKIKYYCFISHKKLNKLNRARIFNYALIFLLWALSTYLVFIANTRTITYKLDFVNIKPCKSILLW